MSVTGVRRDEGESGVALILVDAKGENVIAVAPGANARLTAADVTVVDDDAVLCQLEIPVEAVAAAAAQAQGLFCLNAAPAVAVPPEVLRRADLVVVNRYELDALAETPRLVALTLGAEGAVLLEDGTEIARAAPPPVTAVDGTAAGDAFCAALLVVAARGARPPRGSASRVCRRRARRLAAGCPTVASHRARAGRDTAHVSTPILLDCDPGHDDAIALFLALASPELELLGVTTVAGNQTLDKTTANAIRLLDAVGRAEIPVAAGADRPFVRERYVAAYVHGESGLDGPDLPPPSREPDGRHAVELLAETLNAAGRPVTLVPTGPLTNIALLLALHPGVEERIERVVLMGGAIAEGNVTPAAEFNIWADPEAARRVFESGLDLTMVGLDVTHQALVGEPEAERMRAAGRAGAIVADLLELLRALPPRAVRVGGLADPRRRRRRVRGAARPARDEAPPRRRRLLLGALAGPHAGRPLGADGAAGELPRRHRDRRARLHRAPDRSSQHAPLNEAL